MTHHKNVLQQTLAAWLPLAIVTLALCALAYVGLQQNYRLSANDPQIQIAQDIAAAINRGDAQASAIVPPEPTSDISSSLATFVVIYSATGTPLGASAGIDGKAPTISQGVLATALKAGENRVTWEPKKGTRIAAVITSFKSPTESGFILVGRSLKEVEIRERLLMTITAAAAAVALVFSFLAVWWMIKKSHKPGEASHESEHHHSV